MAMASSISRAGANTGLTESWAIWPSRRTNAASSGVAIATVRMSSMMYRPMACVFLAISKGIFSTASSVTIEAKGST